MNMTKTVLFSILLADAISQAFGADATPPVAIAGDDIGPTLIALEKQSWEAWKNHDGRFFASFLSEDHLDVGDRGIVDKKSVVAGVAGPFCRVDSYHVDQFHATRLADDAAVVTYRAEQQTMCGKVSVPSPTWVTSVYIKRDGRWRNAVFQKTPAVN